MEGVEVKELGGGGHWATQRRVKAAAQQKTLTSLFYLQYKDGTDGQHYKERRERKNKSAVSIYECNFCAGKRLWK